jgi:hypothetical protein
MQALDANRHSSSRNAFDFWHIAGCRKQLDAIGEVRLVRSLILSRKRFIGAKSLVEFCHDAGSLQC